MKEEKIINKKTIAGVIIIAAGCLLSPQFVSAETQGVPVTHMNPQPMSPMGYHTGSLHNDLRSDPAFREMERIQREMNRLFEQSWMGTSQNFTPRLDLTENKKSYILKVDLPGMEKESINVNTTDDLITVSGERKIENEEEENGYHRIERSYGSFSRTIPMPSNVDTAKIEANYENGVLTITLPKLTPTKHRKVVVQ